MNDLFRKSALPVILLALAGCATQGKPPPTISLDEPVQAQPLPEPPAPVEVVAVPEVLPMPAQLKPLPEAEDAKPTPEPADETVRCGFLSRRSYVAPSRRSRGSAKRPRKELTYCPIYGFKPCVICAKDLTPALFCPHAGAARREEARPFR